MPLLLLVPTFLKDLELEEEEEEEEDGSIVAIISSWGAFVSFSLAWGAEDDDDDDDEREELELEEEDNDKGNVWWLW
jgi:hypothetical protein